MKLFDTFLFSFAILFTLIGIHQAMTVGFLYSYWLFMLALGCLMWYQSRKKKAADIEKANEKQTGSKTEKKRKYKM
jgi:hypothetical protein